MCRYMYFVYRDDLVDTLKHGHKRWCAAHDGVTLPYSSLSTSSPPLYEGSMLYMPTAPPGLSFGRMPA